MNIYTVYNHLTKDFPGRYVVRKSLITDGGILMAQHPLYVGHDLEEARRLIQKDDPNVGRISRGDNDDRVILEVWI